VSLEVIENRLYITSYWPYVVTLYHFSDTMR